MTTNKARILEIEERILEHMYAISCYFQPGMLFTLIGRHPESGCEFIIGEDDPKDVLNYIKRAIKVIEAENKPKKSVTKKAQPKPKKKSVKKAK